MKRVLAIMAALVVVVALAGCSAEKPQSSDSGSGNTSAKTEQAQDTKANEGAQKEEAPAASTAKDAATANSIVTGKVWQYKYVPTADDSESAAGVMTAICDELCKYNAQFYEMADGMFPAVDLVRVADEESGDIKAFGIFETYNYTLDGTTIKEVSGGRDMGCMHLKLDSDGTYKVTKVEFAEDGAGNKESLEKICAGYDDADSIMQIGSVPIETSMQFIKNYVDEYGLDITAVEASDGTVTNL